MLRNRDFELFAREPALGIDGADDGVLLAGALTPMADAPVSSPSALTDDPLAPDEDPPVATDDAPPVLVDGDGNFIPETLPESGALPPGSVEDVASAPVAPDDIDPVGILRDRPDVYAAFYREFYGPHNDRSSPAWHDRVGGETPEDYARYWYNTYGRYEGYTPEPGGVAAPAEGAADAPQGRTTIDGIPLSKILSDRPDVFQAFFTEYYGAGNDRHSDAWVQRVGGATVEDFANYWYNAYGKLEGYSPSAPSAPEPAASPDPETTPDPAPAVGPPSEVDPSLDPWNHPAIYPDWQPPYPGWLPPTAGSDGAASVPPTRDGASPPEDPFVYSDPEAPMLRIVPGQSLFDDSGG